MIEYADPIEFTLRYVGKDTTLESLKELRRLIASGESESNEMCHKLCQWIVENKRNPSLINDEEKFLFYFMTDMRKGRNNPNNQGRLWYESNQKIAESYRLNNIFDNKDYENIAVENCHKLCQFIVENDCYPKASSEDKVEKSLNTFMQNQRSNKLNKSQGRWYPVLEQIASNYGINNLFDQLDDEAICNEKIHELCKFIKSNDYKTPSRTSSNDYERKMFAFLNGLRQAKKNPAIKKRNFYQSSEEIALSYGLKNLFEVTDKELISNSICHELCKYVVKNGKIPARTTYDEREKFLYAWLHTQKNNKSNNKFYDSNQIIAESYNLNNLFDKIDLEKKSNELCIKWCEFFIKNNRKPTQKDIEFQDIYSWFYMQKKAKNGNSNNRFYPSNEIIAESYGINNIFGDKD